MAALLCDIDSARPAAMAPAEWRARVELAACYRLFDFLGWTEGIYNHITLRVGELFLINPYGLHYAEVTPFNLLRMDAAGHAYDTTYPVNAAGAVIHCAVHGARPDVFCVMHTHTTSVMAVACKTQGLRADNFYSAQLQDELTWHAFEGVTTRPDEGQRLVDNLGQRNILMLRNHGVLVTGVGLYEAFSRLWMLQRACDVQLAADSMAGSNQPIESAVLASIGQHAPAMRPGGVRPGEMLFAGLLRRAGINARNLLAPDF